MALDQGRFKARDASFSEILFDDFSENAYRWIADPLPDYAVRRSPWPWSHCVAPESSPPARAQTPMGSRLRSLRSAIVASGEPLLDLDGVRREVAERRGERE